MDFTRREWLTIGLGLLLSGCDDSDKRTRWTDLPSPDWPDPVARPRSGGAITTVPPAQAAAPKGPAVAQDLGAVDAIPRSRWAKAGPMMSRVNPMNGVNRITVHHEGWHTVWFDDTVTTADRLDLIRRSHIERLKAGDIGYHYIIDRAGRVWQGRESRYQGAHVRSQNENNIGIMVLGNFDKQTPSTAQVATLRKTLRQLMAYHKVPVKRVYTHQELNPTACPGKRLQPQMVSLRGNGGLA